MKKLLLLPLIHCASLAGSQEIPPVAEQQLESLMNTGETLTDDDSYLQQLEVYRKNPVNMNTADRNELAELGMLNDLQIENLLAYRRLLGSIIDIHELQAIPSWNISLIRRLLPFVTIARRVNSIEEWKKQFKEGQHSIIIRMKQMIEKVDNNYNGSPQQLLFRHRYQYKNMLQYGLTGEKDAGESFFKGAQRRGFDFYSFHLFTRRKGLVHSLALGDFTINMGQGLILWQGRAIKKSADAMNIKKQSFGLRPYSSTGEFNFHRGAGVTLQKGRLESTVFISFRRLSVGLDTIDGKSYFGSFQTSGYHRTASEIRNKKSLGQLTMGNSVAYKHRNWHIGLNTVYYRFSAQMKMENELYDLFAATGDHWFNISLDYNYLYRNLQVFGEIATDRKFHQAGINGLLLSIDPKIDVAVLCRTISSRYQSMQGNAFTESTFPSNEKGMYAGIVIRPYSCLEINAYADIYQFPWLKYQVDAPSSGKDLLIQVAYTPAKNMELYTKFRNEFKEGIQKQNWRIHIRYMINSTITLQKRVELIWYTNELKKQQAGFLAYIDILYKPLVKPFTARLRLQYFETGGYDSRLYAYENDVLYSYSIPAFYNKGYRYTVNLQYDPFKRISFWLRWAQTVADNKSRELKLQGRIIF